MQKNSDQFAIVLCGGSGTRLWPYSRSLKPKQFLSFGSELTLFQKTLKRVSEIFNEENIFIVTNEDFNFEVKGQAADVDLVNINIILEPHAKNTLPAISYGVKKIHTLNDNAVIGVFSSDHEIDDNNLFTQSWKDAVVAAEKKSFVVFGIEPTEPNIGYGYIKPGEKFTSNTKNIFKVLSFVEKPNELTAKKYVNDKYLWNSGMFVFSIDVFLENLKSIQNDLYEFIMNSDDAEIIDNYSSLPNLSIDYGLLESMNNISVVQARFKWTDLGSWNSIHSYLNQSKDLSTFKSGNVISEDTENSLIMTDEHLIATYGLKDLIVIHDLDATLICHKSKADDLKPFLKKIQEKNENYLKTHPIVNRPWGHFKILYEGPTFKIKSIVVKPMEQLSLQLHNFRNEHWVVINGTATVTKDDDIFELCQNESTYIKIKEKHRLENNTNDLLEIIEVSIGEKVVEEDIVRFEDRYHRKN